MLERIKNAIGSIQIFFGILTFFLFQFGLPELQALFMFETSFFLSLSVSSLSAIFILSGFLLLV